jgi:hypothetical protein
LRQLLVQTAQIAQKRFKGKEIRVWYVMLGENRWKAFIINSVNKIKLAEGPVRVTAEASLTAIKNQMEAAIRKTS